MPDESIDQTVRYDKNSKKSSGDGLFRLAVTTFAGYLGYRWASSLGYSLTYKLVGGALGGIGGYIGATIGHKLAQATFSSKYKEKH